MNAKTFDFTRRRFLSSAGVMVALPWLESLPVWGADPSNSSIQPPIRFACMHMAHGVVVDKWWAKGAGAEMELSKTLQPLAPFTEKLQFIKGMKSFGSNVDVHTTSHILSGAKVTLNGDYLDAGTSMDQVIARQLENETPSI